LQAKVVNVLCGTMIIVYTTVFMEIWKRSQIMFAVNYGQLGAEENEVERPNFRGEMVRSLGSDEVNTMFYPEIKRSVTRLFSYTVALLILSVCITLVVLLLFAKSYFVKLGIPERYASSIPSIINSAQIAVFNQLYTVLLKANNNKENHETLSSYEASYTAKLFGFSFLNTFNSFFIIAFLKDSFGLDCVGTSDELPDYYLCFSELSVQLRTVFVLAIVKNMAEFGLPYAKVFLATKRAGRLSHQAGRFKELDEYVERQDLLENYQVSIELDGTIQDYMELMIQYGFLAMFSLAFPLAFLLAFVNNIIEIQVDKAKILRFTKRPIPKVAASIGSWQQIVELISFSSIFANAGLICFTSASFYNDRLPKKGLTALESYDRTLVNLQSFVGMSFFFLGIRFLLDFLIEDIPANVQQVLARHTVTKKKFMIGKGLSAESRIARAAVHFWLPETVALDQLLRASPDAPRVGIGAKSRRQAKREARPQKESAFEASSDQQFEDFEGFEEEAAANRVRKTLKSPFGSPNQKAEDGPASP
jgi:anoctamin-10